MEMPFLIELYKKEELNRISEFLDFMTNMDMNQLYDGYKQLRDSDAPKRKKPYFVDTHNGIASSGLSSTRREEHLALALFNGSLANKEFVLPDGRLINFIDYQTPLKAKQTDKGIGKVDLFGAIDNRYPAVIELKIEGANGSYADSPLHALLEGLAYCAIIEANSVAIFDEAVYKYDIQFSNKTPVLVVLAPDGYWINYLTNKKAGNWLPELVKMSNKLNHALDIEILLLAITDAGFEMGLDGASAKLTGDCNLVSVKSLASLL
jgi:hypothetical protein